jgi:thioesterase domain-containing protein
MIDRTALCAELTGLWHRDIPLTAQIGVAATHYDGETLTVRAPFAPNRNLHGTTFAGSLFSVCALTGWGAIWLRFRERGLQTTLVVAESSVQFRKAVAADALCRCTLEAAAAAAALAEFTTKGRASLALSCAIDTDAGRAVEYAGTYVALAKRH